MPGMVNVGLEAFGLRILGLNVCLVEWFQYVFPFSGYRKADTVFMSREVDTL